MTRGLGEVAWAVIVRELKLTSRRWDQAVQPLVFFCVVTTLFPLATTSDLAELRRIAPGVLWVAAMLASLLALESLFHPDVEDGTMEQWVLSQQPLAWLLLAKTAVHWLITGMPLVLVSPLLASALGMPPQAWSTVIASLAIGTATLSVLGAVGAALTVSLRRGNMLVALLVLPLEMPLLIFGARAIELASYGENPSSSLMLLTAVLLFSVSLGPFAMAQAMRIGIE
jgi:heme exporter protein B